MLYLWNLIIQNSLYYIDNVLLFCLFKKGSVFGKKRKGERIFFAFLKKKICWRIYRQYFCNAFLHISVFIKEKVNSLRICTQDCGSGLFNIIKWLIIVSVNNPKCKTQSAWGYFPKWEMYFDPNNCNIMHIWEKESYLHIYADKLNWSSDSDR